MTTAYWAAKANQQVQGVAANFEALYEERARLIADVERLTVRVDQLTEECEGLEKEPPAS